METIKQKPWYKSFSNWLAIVVAFLGAVVQLTTDGVLPIEGVVASLMPALLLILKRMSNENTAMKANAHVEAAKLAGAKEPANPI